MSLQDYVAYGRVGGKTFLLAQGSTREIARKRASAMRQMGAPSHWIAEKDIHTATRRQWERRHEHEGSEA